jgi:hypothetical protein
MEGLRRMQTGKAEDMFALNKDEESDEEDNSPTRRRAVGRKKIELDEPLYKDTINVGKITNKTKLDQVLE